MDGPHAQVVTVSTYVWDIRIPGVPNMPDADVLAVRRQFHQTLMRLLLAKRSAKLSLNEVRALFAGHSLSHGIRSYPLPGTARVPWLYWKHCNACKSQQTADLRMSFTLCGGRLTGRRPDHQVACSLLAAARQRCQMCWSQAAWVACRSRRVCGPDV